MLQLLCHGRNFNKAKTFLYSIPKKSNGAIQLEDKHFNALIQAFGEAGLFVESLKIESEEFEKISSSEECKAFSEKLEEVQDWLYMDGEDSSASEFQKRLETLKAVGDPIFFRYNELPARPTTLEHARRYLIELQLLYGAVIMNNVLCLSVFLAIVYVRGLTWDFSSKVLVILIVCIVMGVFGSVRTTFPLWTSIIANQNPAHYYHFAM